MTIAIMQPYFLPYIGYWQLINAVDTFIVYDDVTYIKSGWINRNYILINNQSSLLTIPLKNASSFKLINEIEITNNKAIKTIQQAYCKAPYFKNIFNNINNIFNSNTKIADLNYELILFICNYLSINTTILRSSNLNYKRELKGQNKVINICKQFNTKKYINAIGGIELYSKEEFLKNNIELRFIKTNEIYYKQFNDNFVGNLSILDIMMFNDVKEIQKMLREYSLIEFNWGGVNLLLEIGNLKYTATKELKWAS